jgi:hypothetical protein
VPALQLVRRARERVEGGYGVEQVRVVAVGPVEVLAGQPEANARSLVYLEDQYFWSRPAAACFADALAENPQLRLIAVIPQYPDRDGKLSMPPNLICRQNALDRV